MMQSASLFRGYFAEVSADEARKAAQKILATPKYRPMVKQPRPLSTLGRLERRFFSALGDFIGRITPGTGLVQWMVLAAIIVVAALAVARFLSKRTKRQPVSASALATVSIDALDAEAQDAMSRGDYRAAVLLRFRAGIARLERGPRPAASRSTNGNLGFTIPVSFPSIGDMFDRIRYGDRRAEREHAELAATEWPKIVDEARVHMVTPANQLSPRKKRSPFRRRP